MMDDPPPPHPPKKTAYKNQAKKLLEKTFPGISCAAINAVLSHFDFHFTEAYHVLNGIQAAYDNDDGENVFPQMPPRIKVRLKHLRPKKRLLVQDASLLEEIRAIPALYKTKEDDHYPIAGIVNEVAKEDDAAADKDALVECGCCYGDYPPEDMKECSANVGHRVCKECIYRYVSEQLDGNNCINFQCIINETCGHAYHHSSVLDQVLTPRLRRRTNEAFFRSAIEQAGVEGMWTCQKCSYIGFLDGRFATVHCPECNEMYCTQCNRTSHGKLTCEEVEAEANRLKDPVHLAHEKMSEATIRRCPTCFTPFTKRDGCNKMTCRAPGCNTLSCYLCEVQVEGYKHFCNHKRTSKEPCFCGKKCELWTSTENMIRRDRQARRNAGRKVLLAAGMAADKIENILASPAKKNVHPPRVAHVQPVPQQQAPAVAAPVENNVPDQPAAVPEAPAVAPVQPAPHEAQLVEAQEDNDRRQCCIIL